MLMVFMSQPDFGCNPHALWDYVTHNTDIETAWVVKKIARYEALVERGIRCEVYGTLAAEKLIASADIIIANSYTYLEIPKKEHQLLVNLWHGSGVKAHDYYDHNLNPRHAIKLEKYFKLVDLMCVHSLDDRFKLSAMLHYDLRKMYVTGQPRLDLVNASDGKEKLVRMFGEEIGQYDKLIFFAPSYRANMSCHAGKIFSDNIFRLDDYEDSKLDEFLKKNNAAIVYKLHPIEQTAFSGRIFSMSGRCFELTDEMLFNQDIRYDELLNAFDVMVSDYSSIVYDYLLLDRPVVYLLPDFDEYKNKKGFVFSNIDAFMPGEKAYTFEELMPALSRAFENPDAYKAARENVILNRFDYTDGKSTQRCFECIMNYKKISDEYVPYESAPETVMPSITEQISPYIEDEKVLLIDSRKEYDNKQEILDKIENASMIYYVTAEIPGKFRGIYGANSYKIKDLEFYYDLLNNSKVNIAYIMGGVDYNKFSVHNKSANGEKVRIGFAGTIDNRIYFSMVHCICEEFSDCEIVFAGTIIGDYPAWLNGFDNLKYIEAEYDKLPEIIESFDVAILPFFGGHRKLVPCELYQYLACGKNVVTSDMFNLPECDAIYKSASVADVIENIHRILDGKLNKEVNVNGTKLAKENDWANVARNLLEDKYNYTEET